MPAPHKGTYKELLQKHCDYLEKTLSDSEGIRVQVKLDIWHEKIPGYNYFKEYFAKINVGYVLCYKSSNLCLYSDEECVEELCENLYDYVSQIDVLSAYENKK